MVRKCVFVILFACFCWPGITAQWKYLRIRYEDWFHIPYSVSEITSVREANFDKYVFAGHDPDLNVDCYSYVNDTRVVLLFDTHGNIGGLRFCYIKSDVGRVAVKKNLTFPFDYDRLVGQFYTEQNYWDTPAWCNDVLVTSPDTLRRGGRPALNGYPVEQLWLRLRGKWIAMPEDESKAEALGFTKQGYYPGMGLHYSYEMAPETPCERFVPSTLLFNNSKLIGCNLPTFGAYTSGERVWFESFTKAQVQAMSPNSSECSVDWIFTYGATSCHVSFLYDHTLV